MRAGDLRHRVQLQQRAAAADALGQPSLAWTNVATRWAEVSALSGRQLVAGQAIRVEVTHLISLRYEAQFADPKQVAAMRILYAGRIFNIHASRDLEERHRSIELWCSEGLNDG